MKIPLIVANWKLNGNENILTKYVKNLYNKFNNVKNINIAIAPPIIYLNILKKIIGKKNIFLCSQNVDIHENGSFTGEISAKMLKDIGVKYSIIGHSERRNFHKENYEYISKKFNILIKNNITPILCVGENIKEYISNKSIQTCINQISCIINNLGIKFFKNIVIAYEPIWAIGTGHAANKEHIQKVHKNIRKYIKKYDKKISESIIIQYGGSVNIDNVKDLFFQKDINGFLIGKSSLEINNFISIINNIQECL
ncbi:triose-phosphate isomerase [Sodalis-like secondary symbiont of Drepanosiphum platanoidis]|uniref:triose-phosphate isomerase n=1 Tax=Sodalis-like secondary symbiont of Drepanosiphum platanoidis TaxID=2994493 RepID=UPI003464586E